MITDERIHEIARRLADLGPLDGWHSEISNEGDLKFWLPEQFRWPEGFWIDNMETSTQADHALLEFLGDAPHAIRDLLDLVRRYRAALEQTVSACEVCDQGSVDYVPPGLDAWLPTGAPNTIEQDCPYCGPARQALDIDETTSPVNPDRTLVLQLQQTIAAALTITEDDAEPGDRIARIRAALSSVMEETYAS